MSETKTIEERLKEYILSRYKSIRAFTQEADVPYSTVDTMLKRGISGTGVNTVAKICKALMINLDSLSEGQIVSLSDANERVIVNRSLDEQRLLDNFKHLSAKGKVKLLEYSDDLVKSGNYILNEQKEKHA